MLKYHLHIDTSGENEKEYETISSVIIQFF